MPKRTARAASRTPAPATVVCQISDVHFSIQDPRAWASFRQWHAIVRPDVLAMNGDMIDLGMLSSYRQEDDAPLFAIEQIKEFVRETNSLREECGRLVFMEGNHEARWSRVVGAVAAAGALKGAKGLSLEDQCRAHGLRSDVEWMKESVACPGVMAGHVLLRHGHKQAGKHGGAKHLTANALSKTMGRDVSFGHHHRGMLSFQTSLGRTAFALANPCMVNMQEYNPDGDCQQGFSCFNIDDRGIATPDLIVMNEGRFAWGGMQFDGGC